MFKEPFSFEGRIRRTEYGVTLIIYIIVATIINLIIQESNGDAAILGIAFIPMIWILWAQGAKRCHDIGNSGWWQLIPFYVFWMLFQDGEPSTNQYGENPKGIQHIGGNNPGGQSGTGGYQGGYSGGHNNPSNFGNSGSTGYQGGYSGGHNNPNTNYHQGNQESSSGEYKDGNLYN